FSCAYPQTAMASTPEMVSEVQKLWVHKGKGSYPPTQRLLIAQAFEKYWTSFLVRIPRLSPAEQAWIDQEVRSQSSERLNAIWQRTEYAKYSLVNHATRCKDIFRKLQSHIGSESAEAYLWVKSLQCHMNEDANLARHLQRLNLMQQRYDESFHIALFS